MTNVEELYNASLGNIEGRRGVEKYMLVLFLLWPFAALLQAVRFYRSTWAKNIVWLFFIFSGFTFVIISSGADAARYRDGLTMMANSDMGLSELFSTYLSENSKTLDIGQRLVTLLVSKYTTDYRILFAIFAVFMGYFLSRIIWFLIDRTYGRIGLFAAILLISYSLVVGIWDIGGIRWNIAAVIFVYGLLIYFFDHKKSAYWLIGSTIFIHWSFTIALGIFIIYRIIGNRPYTYFILFVISFFIAQIDLEIVRSIFYAYAPKAVLVSRGSYLSEFYVDSLNQNISKLNWYILGHALALKWFVFFFALLIFFYFKKMKIKSSPLFTLFNFGMLFYGVFNILSNIPSVGRFMAVGNLIMLAVFFLIIQGQRAYFPKWIKVLGIPLLLLFIIVRLRIGFDYMGLWTVIGNPLIAIFAGNDYALIDLIKGDF